MLRWSSEFNGCGEGGVGDEPVQDADGSVDEFDSV